MSIQSLYLRHFRNYEEGYIEFHDGINLLHGANAQGKTTILEALYCFIVGRSFRTNQPADLIQYGKDFLQCECRFSKYNIEQSLKLHSDGKKRSLFYNHTPLQGISNLLGILPGVIMTPEDINLIKGAPQLRRQFLDIQLAQSDPLYTHHLMRYTRALRQRNQLLKAKQKATLESWEQEMSLSAAYLVKQRTRAIKDLQEYGQRAHATLSGEVKVWTLDYKTGGVVNSTDTRELMQSQRELFAKHRDRELHLGYTLSGPHKDDFIMKLDGKEVSDFASEGQQRCSVIALRFAEWQRLHVLINESPLLMIDDVGISLDARRHANLLNMLVDFEQVFLTTTETSLFDSIPVKGKKIQIPLREGK